MPSVSGIYFRKAEDGLSKSEDGSILRLSWDRGQPEGRQHCQGLASGDDVVLPSRGHSGALDQQHEWGKPRPIVRPGVLGVGSRPEVGQPLSAPGQLQD